MSTFQSYSTPSHLHRFSASHIQSLTFAEIAAITDWPKIAPTGSVTSWEWSDVDLAEDSIGSEIQPNEVIPNALDLGPILVAMQNEFNYGRRSVVIYMCDAGQDLAMHYHFLKIHLIRDVCQFDERRRRVTRMVEYLRARCSQHLDPAVLEQFEQSKFLDRLSGFFSVRCNLYSLESLIGEKWVEENILSALMELEYFRRHAVDVQQNPFTLGDAPTHILLPPDFLADLDIFCADNERLIRFPACERLRIRLSHTQISSISLARFSEVQGHFTALTHHVGNRHLEFGDSMHHACDPQLGIRVQAALSTTALPIPAIVQEGKIERQGINGGEGSCAIAMLNYVQRAIYPGMEKWTCVQSALFRDVALCDLIHYHVLALAVPGKPEDWIEPACDILGETLQREEMQWWAETTQVQVVQGNFKGSAFYDYNLYKPFAIHPIFDFHDKHPSWLNRRLPPIASLFGLATSQRGPALAHTALLPAATIEKRSRSESLSHAQTDKRPAKRRIAIDVNLLPSPEVEIVSESVRLPNSVKVEEQSDDEIEFISPPRTPLQQVRNRKVKSEVIDLVTPPTEVGKKPAQRPIKKDPADIRTPFHSTGKTVKLEDIKPRVFNLSSSSDIVPTPPPPGIDRLYESWEEAQTAVYAFEKERGHIWCKGQTLNYPDGGLKKVTLRCKCYRKANPTHDKSLDPSQHRQGKSGKTDCAAHVNVNFNKTLGHWRVTTCELTHNHPPILPVGAKLRAPASTKQKDVIRDLATNNHQRFTRSQVAEVLLLSAPDEPELEPRQISALITKHRAEAREDIKSQGGDCAAIAKDLKAKQAKDPRWRYEISISPDGSGIVDGVFWQSPLQAELSDRYGDVLVFDSTYKRNDVEYPLSIGIVIDGFCASRNAFYAVTATEGSEQVKWIFQCYLRFTKSPPTTFISDRHATLLSVIPVVLPLTDHLYCLHHLLTNVDQNLRRKLGARWGEFMSAFWVVYRAVSPEIFARLWETLLARFPEAADYLRNELWPCREKWAWTYTAYKFTVGIRTSGRVESENRVTRAFSGAKTSLFQLYTALNERTSGQSVKEMRSARDAFRQKHPTPIESVFPGPLALFRRHTVPFALQTGFKQMELSLYYNVTPLQLPAGLRYWTEHAITVTSESSFEWEGNQEQPMLDCFQNDSAHLDSKWLLRLVVNQGLRVRTLFRVQHVGSGKSHILAFMDDQSYVCDCTMGLSLGIPCRHYFTVLSASGNTGIRFHMSVINRRWYQDANLDISSISSVSAREADTVRSSEPTCIHPNHTGDRVTPSGVDTKLGAKSPISHQSAIAHSNPLYVMPGSCDRPPTTQTLPAREVFHEAQAALRPLVSSVHTEEELNKLLRDLSDLRRRTGTGDESTSGDESLRDPPARKVKGRPRSKRLTGSTEGRPQGGGGSGSKSVATQTGPKKCGICKRLGHNRKNCPRLLPSSPDP